LHEQAISKKAYKDDKCPQRLDPSLDWLDLDPNLKTAVVQYVEGHCRSKSIFDYLRGSHEVTITDILIGQLIENRVFQLHKASKKTAKLSQGTLTGKPSHSVMNTNDCSCRKVNAKLGRYSLRSGTRSSFKEPRHRFLEIYESSKWLTTGMVGGGIDYIVTNHIFQKVLFFPPQAKCPSKLRTRAGAYVAQYCRVNVFMQCTTIS